MDENQLKDFVNAMGMIAEISLLFYRTLLESHATQEEAMQLTQAFIAAILYGGKNSGIGQS